MREGILFDLKEFAVYDGPGVRQTVFLKGCPLRCVWCHNPEGLESRPQLMVSAASCTHCGRCAAVCPTPEGCTACGRCVGVCPLDLRKRSGWAVSAQELAKRLQRDAAAYRSLGGGVTFSGGEPLMQGEFLLETLALLEGMHTAVETSGYAEGALFREVVKRLDFVMVDLKLMDPQEHRRYTGVDNGPILENIAWLDGAGVPYVVRIPVIPGVNDSPENFTASAAFLRGAKRLERVEFLPYHKTAGAKYAMLGREYRPAFDTERAVRINRQPFTDCGIRSVIL